MKKTCCNKFKHLLEGESSFGLNIRVIKSSNSFINESKKRGFSFQKKDSKYNFILTEGYNGKLDNQGQSTFINFCPFCGINLKKFYKNDIYINEDNHIW